MNLETAESTGTTMETLKNAANAQKDFLSETSTDMESMLGQLEENKYEMEKINSMFINDGDD